MGALKNHLQIACYCSEAQMSKIMKAITRHISDAQPDDISDFDDTIGGVRVCIDFEPYFDRIEIKAAEILDHNWELLFEDSAVLVSRLRPIVEEYNREYTDTLQRYSGGRYA